MARMTFSAIRGAPLRHRRRRSTGGASRRAPRAALSLGVVALLAITVGLAGTGLEPAQAAPPRVTGIVPATPGFSAFNSQSPKTATAECPAGTDILGGGYSISTGVPAVSNRVTVTQLEPFEAGTFPDGYRVSAAETLSVNGLGVSGSWGVVAIGICAESVPGHHIVGENTDVSSDPVQTKDAECLPGERVLGTGARITFGSSPRFGVGLQVARTDALGGLTRAQAQEQQPGGYAFTWRLRAFAVCGTTPQGYEVRSGGTGEPDSDTPKVTGATCSNGRLMTGPGAAVAGNAPGNVTLHAIGFNRTRMDAEAVENSATNANWDLLARAICVQ
jgi:hypothetical protein